MTPLEPAPRLDPGIIGKALETHIVQANMSACRDAAAEARAGQAAKLERGFR